MPVQVPCSLTPLRIWIDVDGTCEFGSPVGFAEIEDNCKHHVPIGRSYNYNLPLFDALNAAGEPYRIVSLFTAYRAGTGASTLMGVLRCELVDWMEKDRQLIVSEVVTLLDPIYAKGPGQYYRDYIGPVERALLASGKEALKPDDMIPLPENANCGQLSLRDIIHLEEVLISEYWKSFQHAPNKGEMARYCLDHDARIRDILFFDDKTHYLEEVKEACMERNVKCRLVHVTDDMRQARDYMKAAGIDRRCVIS